MDEIASGPRKVWHSNRSASGRKPRNRRKRKPRSRKRLRKQAHKPRTTAQSANADAKRRGAPKAALPDFVAPCLATLVDKAPDSGDWMHEIKFDGYRIQARLDDGKVKLLTRKGLDWTTKFPTVAAARRQAAGTRRTARRRTGRRKATTAYRSFSCCSRISRQAGTTAWSLCLRSAASRWRRPSRCRLIERKAALATLLKRRRTRAVTLQRIARPSGARRCSSTPARWASKASCRSGADAPYRSGRGGDWLKTKCSDRQEFVVAGYAPSTADAHAIGALVLGYLRRTANCTTPAASAPAAPTTGRARLYRKLKPLRRRKTRRSKRCRRRNAAAQAGLGRAEDGGRSRFPRLDPGDRVRQASFQGLREDKPAKEVVREVKKPAAAATARRDRTQRASAAKRKERAKTCRRSVTLTHPDRVYWEDAGVTKHELAEYYSKVWKWMRPHVIGRVMALVRCPEGADGPMLLPEARLRRHRRPSICTGAREEATRSFASTTSTG